jgi:HEPN domain-containing protein
LNLRELALGYLRQAEARLEDAKDALSEGNNAYALRLSQECVELSVKAALRDVAIEYPKQHEVSDLLLEFKQRFPPWFAEEVEFIQQVSVSLFKKRELAFYGGEDVTLPPDRVIGAEDGKIAVDSATRVFSDCSKLLQGG